MDTRQLRYFVAVYEHRNLGLAAQAKHVAQSAISQQILKLETEHGVQLFHRLPRGMQPTAAGTRLYEHAQVILRSMSAASDDLRHFAAEISGDIQLGLPFTVIDAIGIELMTQFRELYPKARLILHESLSADLHHQLLAGEHDWILSYNPPRQERVVQQRVVEEELCCIGTREYLGDDDQRPILLDDMLRLPQVVLRRGEASRSMSAQGRLLDELHAHAVIEINSTNGLRKAVSAGVGVVASPTITFRDLVAEGIVLARPIEPRTTRLLQLCRLADRLPTALMEAAQTMTLGLIRQQVDARRWDVVTVDD